MTNRTRRGQLLEVAFGHEPDIPETPATAAKQRGVHTLRAQCSQIDSAVFGSRPATFNRANLAGVDLSKINLCGASMRFACLSAASFEAADLSGADLRHGHFEQAKFTAALLTNGVFDHADFSNADFQKANLVDVSARFANFSGADLEAADLTGADLRYAQLARVNFRGANLSGTLLDYADFADSNLANADLSGASLSYAKNITLEQLEPYKLSDSTTLPFHVYGTPRLLRMGAPSVTPGHRPAWMVGGFLVVAALGLAGFVWQHSGLETLQEEQTSAGALQLFGSNPGKRGGAIVRSLPEAEILTSLNADAPDPEPLSETTKELPVMVDRSPSGASLLPTQLKEASMSDQQGAPTLRASPAELVIAARVIPFDSLLDIPPPLVTAALPDYVVAVRTLAIEATEAIESAGEAVGDGLSPVFGQPLTLVVSLAKQKVDVFRGTTLVTSSQVSTGMPGHATKAGIYSILEKQRFHHSNMYSGAPMPWMNRITWSGTALHAGIVPSYPASHGCIRLPFSFAPNLFKITAVGDNVIVARDALSPKPIEHPALFRPLSSTDRAEIDPRPEWINTGYQPISDQAPLRILLTRQTERDRIIAIQYLLASMGYLKPQNFTGRLGMETVTGIRAFQRANGLSETGAFTEQLTKKVYEIAGKEQPPIGHLYVRQNYRRVFDTSITFRDPDRPLGLHVFTAIRLDPPNSAAQWMAISVEGGTASSVLDRLEIPSETRQQISERLTVGSTLIVADTSLNSAILPDGDDFLVWAKDQPPDDETRQAKNGPAKPKAKAKAKQANVAQLATRPRMHRRTQYFYYSPPRVTRRGFFWGW